MSKLFSGVEVCGIYILSKDRSGIFTIGGGSGSGSGSGLGLGETSEKSYIPVSSSQNDGNISSKLDDLGTNEGEIIAPAF